MKKRCNKNISAQPSIGVFVMRKIAPLLGCCAFFIPLHAQPVQYEMNTDSMVRVAYGTQARDQVSAAISSISGSELRKIQAATLTNAMIGKLPGVTIMSNGGAPGFDEPGILIRGQHTMLNNGVLLLVDGIQVNNISFLSPDEIESVSVLKDAAALALYGARGANGVLLVTTRRGSISKTNITLNIRYGSQSPVRLPKMTGSYNFARLYNEALQNDGLPPLYTEAQLEGYRLKKDPYRYPDVNWFDEILRKNSPVRDVSVTFDGGNQTAKYFVMAGFINNQGLYAHTDQEHNSNINYNGLNFRANLDLNVTRSFSVQVGLGGNIQDRKFPPVTTESLWKNMATYAPNLYPVTTPDGLVTGTASYPNNPLGDLLKRGYQSRHDRNIQMNIRATQRLDVVTPGLKVFGAVLFDNLLQSRYDKTRSYAYYEPIVTTGAGGQDSLYYMQRGLDSDLSVATGNDYENNRLIYQGGLDYSRSFGHHGLGAMLFFQQDKYTVLNNPSPFAMQNLAGRLTYNYREKYFAEWAFSYSGLENYPPGRRFGLFPALSVAWLMHKENFLQQSAWVNYLKLRLSAGMVGNDKGAPRFNYNQYWGIANSQGYYFGPGQSWFNGLVQLGMANPDITWERARMLDFGIDAVLFNNRLSINADVFSENRSRILVDMSATSSALSGYTAGIMANRGRVANYGTEISAIYNGEAGAVKYYAGGQFSYAVNKIRESYETPKKEAYSYRQGHPVGQYFGLEAIGYFRDESDIVASPVQTFSIVRPGDLKYKDQNNDGLIDVNDQVAIGKQNYPQISYGFSSGVAYKGINLDLFLQGVANRSVYMNGYLFQPFINNANILDWAANGRWTPETHASATYPRLTTQLNPNNYQASTFWVRKADFLRLRNIELGYTLAGKWLAGIGVRQVKLYVSGQNLVTWDNLAVDVDPETLSIGYPVLKSYMAGISVKF